MHETVSTSYLLFGLQNKETKNVCLRKEHGAEAGISTA